MNVSGAGSFNLGEIQGTVANTIEQLSSSGDAEQIKIQELLTKLQEAIAAEEKLNNEDKGDALEAVKTLAEVEQNTKEPEKKEKGKKAIRSLTRIIQGLPIVTQLVQEFNKLIPEITKLIGL